VFELNIGEGFREEVLGEFRFIEFAFNSIIDIRTLYLLSEI
jgi:hypothetical protein